MNLPTTLPPAPTGLRAQYFGAGGATARYYWVRANYPMGKSSLAGPVLVTTHASLEDNSKEVLVQWDAMPGAQSYDVLQTTTSTLPTAAAAIANSVGLETNAFTDTGVALVSYTPYIAGDSAVLGNLGVAHAKWDFTVDGGAISTITPVLTAQIPKGAIIVGGAVFVPVACVGASGTMSVGTSAGSSTSSLLAATAVASLSLNAMINLVPVFATAVRMTAAGNVTVTIATTAFSAGAVEIFILYFQPSVS